VEKDDIDNIACHGITHSSMEYSHRHIDYSVPIFMDKFHSNGGGIIVLERARVPVSFDYRSGLPLLTWSSFVCLLK